MIACGCTLDDPASLCAFGYGFTAVGKGGYHGLVTNYGKKVAQLLPVPKE